MKGAKGARTSLTSGAKGRILRNMVLMEKALEASNVIVARGMTMRGEPGSVGEYAARGTAHRARLDARGPKLTLEAREHSVLQSSVCQLFQGNVVDVVGRGRRRLCTICSASRA